MSQPSPLFILTTAGEILGVDTPGNLELVRRIYACVNACEGISTAELEAGVVAQMRETLLSVLPLLQSASTSSNRAAA